MPYDLGVRVVFSALRCTMQNVGFRRNDAIASLTRAVFTLRKRPNRIPSLCKTRQALRPLSHKTEATAVTPHQTSNGLELKMPHSPEGFSADQKSFASVFSIRGYEVGPDRRASIVTIANLLQETGANHCVGLWGMSDEGFAIDPTMVKRNLIWVMTRLQIQMTEYPRWGDVVEVETWLHPEGRAAANREYLLRDAKSKAVLGAATSIWVCVNAKRRRIVRIPEDIRERSEPFAAPNRPCPLAEDEVRLKIEDIDETRASHGPIRFAGHMNIDMNNHINNVAYLTWALDLLQDEIFETYRLKQLEIDFKAECEAGDRIEGHLMEIDAPSFPCEKQFAHSLFVLMEESKKKELVRLRTSWVQ